MADDYSSRTAGSNGPADTQKNDGEERWFDRVLSVFGLRHNEGLRENLAQALAADDGTGAIFSPEERRLLQNILALRDVRISDVMIPRADINAVPDAISLGNLMKTFRDAGHSRLPVYRGNLDNPVGFVHAKDVMIAMAEEAADEGEGGLTLGAVDLSRPVSAMNILRPILYVPPSMPVMDLMVRMQTARTQLALVVDEYGGTDGLVSLEDLIETVVGDIEDEYDFSTEPTMEKSGEHAWTSDARVAVDDFVAESGVRFPESDLLDDVDTIGGIVFAILGRVPVRGEIVSSSLLPGFEFEVLEADLRRIKRVKVVLRQNARAAQSEGAGAAA